MPVPDQFNLNKVTLECFSKCKVPIKAQAEPHTNTQQKNFYRRRILSITKDLSKGNSDNQSLLDAYDMYVSILIKHFKASDKSFLIQKEFEGLKKKASMCEKSEPVWSLNKDPMLFTHIQNSLDDYVVRTRHPDKPLKTPPKIKQINLNSSRFRWPRKKV